jgi:hypothetical protein
LITSCLSPQTLDDIWARILNLFDEPGTNPVDLYSDIVVPPRNIHRANWGCRVVAENPAFLQIPYGCLLV